MLILVFTKHFLDKYAVSILFINKRLSLPWPWVKEDDDSDQGQKNDDGTERDKGHPGVVLPPGVGLGHHADDVSSVLEAGGHTLYAVDAEWSADQFDSATEGSVDQSQSSTGFGGSNPERKILKSIIIVDFTIISEIIT